jgi:PAS domain-containing protein
MGNTTSGEGEAPVSDECDQQLTAAAPNATSSYPHEQRDAFHTPHHSNGQSINGASMLDAHGRSVTPIVPLPTKPIVPRTHPSSLTTHADSTIAYLWRLIEQAEAQAAAASSSTSHHHDIALLRYQLDTITAAARREQEEQHLRTQRQLEEQYRYASQRQLAFEASLVDPLGLYSEPAQLGAASPRPQSKRVKRSTPHTNGVVDPLHHIAAAHLQYAPLQLHHSQQPCHFAASHLPMSGSLQATSEFEPILAPSLQSIPPPTAASSSSFLPRPVNHHAHLDGGDFTPMLHEQLLQDTTGTVGPASESATDILSDEIDPFSPLAAIPPAPWSPSGFLQTADDADAHVAPSGSSVLSPNLADASYRIHSHSRSGVSDEEDDAGGDAMPVDESVASSSASTQTERELFSKKFLENYLNSNTLAELERQYDSGQFSAEAARHHLAWIACSLEADEQSELLSQLNKLSLTKCDSPHHQCKRVDELQPDTIPCCFVRAQEWTAMRKSNPAIPDLRLPSLPLTSPNEAAVDDIDGVARIRWTMIRPSGSTHKRKKLISHDSRGEHDEDAQQQQQQLSSVTSSASSTANAVDSSIAPPPPAPPPRGPHRMLHVNRAFERLTGFSQSEMVAIAASQRMQVMFGQLRKDHVASFHKIRAMWGINRVSEAHMSDAHTTRHTQRTHAGHGVRSCSHVFACARMRVVTMV